VQGYFAFERKRWGIRFFVGLLLIFVVNVLVVLFAAYFFQLFVNQAVALRPFLKSTFIGQPYGTLYLHLISFEP